MCLHLFELGFLFLWNTMVVEWGRPVHTTPGNVFLRLEPNMRPILTPILARPFFSRSQHIK